MFGVNNNPTQIVTGPSGPIGNEASLADSTNAEAILSQYILVGGTGANNALAITGQATGGSGTDTFGNHALNGKTAISGDVHIHDNSLTGNGSSGDTLLIQAHAFGGNEGSTGWDGSTVNTDANLADGAGSVAISAQASVDHNILMGGAGGAEMTIDAEASGGNILGTFGLYANHAVNGGTATSALVNVDNNTFNGNGAASTTDTMTITAIAHGGNALNPGFSANVSGFAGYGDGTAVSADINVHDNTMIEHGAADANLSINAIAYAGNGQYFANYNYGNGTVIGARITLDHNTLAGGSGNDTLAINATAHLGTANNADNNAVASEFHITNNHLLGGAGNDELSYNNAALLVNGSGNILDGGTGFDTLVQQITDGSIDLTAAGVDTGLSSSLIQNIEKIDLLGNGSNTLTLNGTSVDNMNGTHELFVTGDAGDTVNIGAGWTLAGTILGSAAGDPLAGDAGVSFTHYTQTVGADTVDLYVQSGIGVSGNLLNDQLLVNNPSNSQYYALSAIFNVSGTGDLSTNSSSTFLGKLSTTYSVIGSGDVTSDGINEVWTKYFDTNLNTNFVYALKSGFNINSQADFSTDPHSIFQGTIDPSISIIGVGHTGNLIVEDTTFHQIYALDSGFNIHSTTDLQLDPHSTLLGFVDPSISIVGVGETNDIIVEDQSSHILYALNPIFNITNTGSLSTDPHSTALGLLNPNATILGIGQSNNLIVEDSLHNIFSLSPDFNISTLSDLSTDIHSTQLGVLDPSVPTVSAGHFF